jgi:3-mercaptopyruvate sulfurtransferase SseA
MLAAAAVTGRAAALLAAGALLGLVSNALRADRVAIGGYSPPVACEGAKGGLPAVEVLPPDRAVKLCGDRGVLVADTRPSQRFAEGHVAEAVHLPCAAPRAEASTVVARLASKHTLIVYGDTTEEARPVAEDLRRHIGRPDLRVVVLDGGFPAWNRAGLACSSGPCKECTARE